MSNPASPAIPRPTGSRCADDRRRVRRLLIGARLRQAGIDDLRIVEKGGDFGGTCYWNRYPGAACDVESYVRRGSLPADYRADIEALLGLVASGAYAPPRPEILPLASAAEAHRRIAAGGLDHRLVLDPWG